MKLRETLLDNGEKGDVLTLPNGIAKYPHNLLFAFLDTIKWASLLGLIIWLKFKIG